MKCKNCGEEIVLGARDNQWLHGIHGVCRICGKPILTEWHRPNGGFIDDPQKHEYGWTHFDCAEPEESPKLPHMGNIEEMINRRGIEHILKLQAFPAFENKCSCGGIWIKGKYGLLKCGNCHQYKNQIFLNCLNEMKLKETEMIKSQWQLYDVRVIEYAEDDKEQPEAIFKGEWFGKDAESVKKKALHQAHSKIKNPENVEVQVKPFLP